MHTMKKVCTRFSLFVQYIDIDLAYPMRACLYLSSLPYVQIPKESMSVCLMCMMEKVNWGTITFRKGSLWRNREQKLLFLLFKYYTFHSPSSLCEGTMVKSIFQV